MLSVSWRWRPLIDDDVGQLFLISPVFGSLHVFDKHDFAKGLPTWTQLIGCTPSTLDCSGWAFSGVEPPEEAHTWYQSDTRHTDWSNHIRSQLNRRPLAWVINKIEKRATRPLTVFAPDVREPKEVMRELLSSWKFSRNPECLPRSLFRYAWLRRRGAFPQLVIGVHLPTDRMHAWVEVDGCVLGEEIDEMLCYQGAVRFFPATQKPDAMKPNG